ncbi:hypothetical protein GBAR_LOCUS18096, partial [Geodia barretti]
MRESIHALRCDFLCLRGTQIKRIRSSFLWSLVEVNSQLTFPYVSFMGQTRANHSYVNFSLIGRTEIESVHCHTDLSTCCRNEQGMHRGDWYFPNGNRL